MTNRELHREIDAYFDAFQEMLPDLMACQPDRWALMRRGECIAFHDTLRDALAAGHLQFVDGLFSVQEVTTKAIDLGWFSRTLH